MADVLFDDGPVCSSLDLHLVGVLDSLGIVDDGRLLDTTAAVIGGLTYNFLPFMILPIYVSLEKIDLRLTEAARTSTTTPLAGVPQGGAAAVAAGVFAGTLLTFIPAAGDFINARVPGWSQNTMIGSVVQDRFLGSATTRPRRRSRSSS